MGVSSGPVTVLNNLAPIGVTCSARARGTCFGTVTLQAQARALAGIHAKAVTLGRAVYAIKRGKTAKVPVPLSKRAFTAINRAGKLKVTVVVTARDSAGNRATPIRRSLWLKVPKKLAPK
jgi:hypothetical protein